MPPTMPTPPRKLDEATLLDRARRGDGACLNSLLTRHQGATSELLRRLLGRHDDADDLLQQSLIEATLNIQNAPTELSFELWLKSIAVEAARVHLNDRTRWQPNAQLQYTASCSKSPELAAELMAVVDDPQFEFDAAAHVGACFVMLGRALPVDEHIALTLHDAMGMTLSQCMAITQQDEAQLERALVRGRAWLNDTFQAQCSLQNSAAACRQCDGFGHMVKSAQRGAPLNPIKSYADRLAIVRLHTPARGQNSKLDRLIFRRIELLQTATPAP